MPLILNNESYNGIGSLKANAGDWVEAETAFSIRFAVGSGDSNKLIYNTFAGNYSLTLQQGDLGADYGFLDGDTIVLTYTLYPVPAAFQSQTFVTTILYVSGNTMFIADPFVLNPPFVYEHINGRQFPTDSFVSGLLIVADKQPASLEFQMNLTPNGSSSFGSVLDSEISRFELPVATGIPTGVPQAMTQLTNKSGSLIQDVEVTLVSTPGGGWRNYRITYKFWQWGVIKNGTPEPNYYDGADHIAPIVKVLGYALYGNPNGVLKDVSENTEADTGGFDENYNGGVSNYTKISIEWQDSLGNPIDALDYSGECTFEALVSAPNQNSPLSTFRIGLVWRPINGTYYQNIANTNVGQNLLVNAPDQDFIGDGSVSAGPFLGYEDANGARWDFEDISFEILPGDQLKITGKVVPNGLATALFAGVPDGGRKSTLWISLGRYDLGPVYEDRVSLKLFDDDNYDAPTIGVQIPNVVDEVLYDHGGVVITAPNPQTTTEDDVLYVSRFRMIDGVQYQGVRAGIWVYNTVTEEQFKLEEIYFDFTSVPFVGSQFQPNETAPRGFNLPPTSDRNYIRLTRDATLDIPGQYGIKIEYGYLSDWRYWMEQSNVDNDFFDILEPFNGKNKDWQRFSNVGDWIVRLSYFTRVAGVDDFNHFPIGIRTYDDEDASTTWNYLVLSSGATPTNLVADEVHEVTATIVWNVGAYTNPWAEITIEDEEGGNRWVISTELDQGGIATNPLQPIPGLTLLDIQFPAVNIAVLRFEVDTSIISASSVCMSARIYSEDEPIPPEFEFLITDLKDGDRAYSDARKLSSDNVYAGPLIRVRRSSDNTELDIMPVLIGSEWVLDQVSLIDFVTENDGSQAWIVTRYDQSGQGAHAVQNVLSDQAPIVIDGVVVLDPDTNRPAHFSNGIDHWYPMPPVSNFTRCLSICVHGVEAIGFNPQNRVGFGNVGSLSSNFPYTYWWFRFGANGGIIYDGVGQTTGINNIHFAGQLQTGAQLNMMWREISNNIEMRLNGVNGTVINEGVPIPGNVFNSIDRRNNRYHRGYKSEDVYYGSDRDQTEVWIENNVNNFYQIF